MNFLNNIFAKKCRFGDVDDICVIQDKLKEKMKTVGKFDVNSHYVVSTSRLNYLERYKIMKWDDISRCCIDGKNKIIYSPDNLFNLSEAELRDSK